MRSPQVALACRLENRCDTRLEVLLVESVAGERAVACEVPHAKEALVNRPSEQRRSVKLDQHSHANKKYVGLRAARDPVSPDLQASAAADYRFDFSCSLGTRVCNGDQTQPGHGAAACAPAASSAFSRS